MKTNILTTSIDGGAGRSAYRLHLGLRDLGIDSQIVSKKKSADLCDHYLQLTPIAHSLRERIQNRIIRSVRRVSERRFEIGRNCQSFSVPTGHWHPSWQDSIASCDILNLHWIAWFIDLPKLFRSLPSDLPIVWTLHDMNPFTGGCHFNGTCNRFAHECGSCPELTPRGTGDLSSKNHAIKRDAFSHIRNRLTIVSPSKWLATQAKQSSLFHSCPVHVIPYGIDTDCFRPVGNCLRQVLGIPDDATLALYIANGIGVYRKGADLLVEALKSIKANNLHLLVVGHGDNRGLVDAIQGKIHFIGNVCSDPLLAAMYSAADFTVIPSRQDNLPNTILESLSCGTPVVGFNIGGVPDMVRPGETGWLASELSSDSLALTLNKAMNDISNHLDLSKKCRSVVEKEYSLLTQARQYYSLYESLLTERNGA